MNFVVFLFIKTVSLFCAVRVDSPLFRAVDTDYHYWFGGCRFVSTDLIVSVAGLATYFTP